METVAVERELLSNIRLLVRMGDPALPIFLQESRCRLHRVREQHAIKQMERFHISAPTQPRIELVEEAAVVTYGAYREPYPDL